MPIANRSIYPVCVSQIKVPPTVENEFEFVVNATLSNLIKQIACLSLKANDIFHELTVALIKFVDRTEALDIKIHSINIELGEIDPTVMKPLVNQQLFIYKSHINRDDELLDHTKMPDCIKEMFNEAQEPPELYKFDIFRQKNEESMRFYTDPDFFLREWLKNARNERSKKKEKKKKRKSVATPKSGQPLPPPPPLMINAIVQEPIVDNKTMDYNYGDVAVYEDPAIFNFSKDANISNDYKNYKQDTVTDVHPLPPPPPILAIFPTCLPPAPPPPPALSPLKPLVPTVKNLLADIQKGSILKPVSERVEIKEKTRDFRELIQELRPAWENHSDDSDESDD